jgi:PEGA domain
MEGMMSARPVMLIAAGALALAPFAGAQDDRAVPRGGGSPSGGGSHPSAGVHSSGGDSHSNPGTSSSSGSGSSGYSGSTAERRHPRAGTGTGHGYGGGYYPGYPVYPGYPGWGGGYYPGWGWGYSYWWPYSGWYGGYWGYPSGVGGSVYHYVGEDAAVRVLVDPSEARVYVDGYYAGTVDDFDGLFQRLRLSPGRHEIALKLEGYKTHRVRVYLTPDRTLKLSYEMQKGQGETFEDLARDVPESDAMRERAPEPRSEELKPGEERLGAAAGAELRLDVEPEDASVYVDGAFRGTGREAASLRLAPGRHRIEVVRPGYRTDEREVEIAPAEPTVISVHLVKAPI